MVVDQPVSNASMALFHATQIAKLRSLNPQANIDAALREELPDGFQSRFFPATTNQVAMYVGGNNNRKICYLDGVTGIYQSTQLIDNYWNVFFLPHSPPLNKWISDNLDYYISRLSGAHFSDPEYFDFVGYSAGGAIANGMVYQLKRLQSRWKIKLVTFGAPRPGGAIVRDTLARTPVARWMTPADPIPLIPPRIQDANTLAALVAPVVWITWASTCHSHGGLQVDAQGLITEAVLPATAAINAGASLVNWYTSANDDPNNDHAIQRYIGNLTANQTAPVEPAKVENPEAPAEVPADDKRREINRQRDRVAGAVANQQREQNAAPQVVPQATLFLPIKLGRVWAVAFGDKLVAQGIHEKTCRHICRAGNDFLRSLPKQAIVDPIALAGQFEAFLALAQDPTTGFSPTIKTTLNQQ